MHSPQRNLRRQALTLVELLVVTTLGVLLIGLTLAAIQRARISAAELQCRNNLRQIGLAWQSCESDVGRYPTNRDLPWTIEIATYLDRPDLRNEYERGVSSEESAINRALGARPIPAYLCPSRAVDVGRQFHWIPGHYSADPAVLGLKSNALASGASNTYLVFETAGDHLVPFILGPTGVASPASPPAHGDHLFAVYGDGSVRAVLPRELAQAFPSGAMAPNDPLDEP